jgi:hypothetical protein
LFVGFGIVLLHILLDGLLHDLDGTLKSVRIDGRMK